MEESAIWINVVGKGNIEGSPVVDATVGSSGALVEFNLSLPQYPLSAPQSIAAPAPAVSRSTSRLAR